MYMNIKKFWSTLAMTALIGGSSWCTDDTVISSRSREARGKIGFFDANTLALLVPPTVETILSREAFRAGCAVSLEAILDKDLKFPIDKDSELFNLLLLAKRPQDIPLMKESFSQGHHICEDNIKAIF